MTPSNDKTFNHYYAQHCKHLKLKGLQPKTIEAYSRGMRRIGQYFSYRIEHLTQAQLLDYFHDLLSSHSWSTVKLDLYGLKFFYTHVLSKPWIDIPMVKSPRVTRIPDIISQAQAQILFMSTRKLSYRIFLFTVYSMGLRLSEGLNLKIGDIDALRQRVHIRDTKGNKDRFVPLPTTTLHMLRRFWQHHKHPEFMFPNRKRGLKYSHLASTPLDRGGIQVCIRQVVKDMGLKKTLPYTVCVTAMPLT